MTYIEKLYIPAGIRFECTGCGNCCLQWPVPATQDDFQNISVALKDIHSMTPEGNWETQLVSADPKTLFKTLSHTGTTDKMREFTHTLQKRSDGRCTFLTEDNRCFLHSRFGESTKPSMCQLFPYTFTQAPDGFYASVSFASTGVLLNHGKLLTDQADFLFGKLLLFKRLYPNLNSDWSQLQLVDGVPLAWDEYLRLEEYLLDSFRFDDSAQASFFELSTIDSLTLASSILLRHVNGKADLERDHLVPTAQHKVDLVLVKTLLEFFFPDDSSKHSPETIDGKALLMKITSAPRTISMQVDHQKVALAEICQLKLPELDKETHQLISRFIYCRIFAKLCWGPGLGHLSVVSGLHFLGVLTALLRIKVKMLSVAQSTTAPVDFLQIAELVRTLERQLTTLRISEESSAVLQVLLESPKRFERILTLAS
jgi:Fe-S-cluster containining protein